MHHIFNKYGFRWLQALLLITASVIAAEAVSTDGLCPDPECHKAQEQILLDMINRRTYTDAVEFYSEIYSLFSSRDSAPYRAMLLDSAADMADQGQCRSVVSLLRSYTAVFLADIDAWSALAYCASNLNQFGDEIDALTQALNQSIDGTEIDSLWERLQKSVDMKLVELEQRRDIDGQIQLLERMIYNWPDKSLFYLRLAEVFSRINDQARVMLTLDLMPFTPELNGRVNALKRGAVPEPVAVVSPLGKDAPELPRFSVPLVRHGSQYIVSASVNGNQTVNLLIDTGASISSVRPAIARRLDTNYQNNRKIRLATANGMARVHTLDAASLAINGKKISGITMAAIELAGSKKIDGLLGMDYLRHFEFSIDQGKSVLYLRRIR